MARKQSDIEKFRGELAALHRSITEDLHLPSLAENRMEGFAALFVMVLPLLNSQGQPVFTTIQIFVNPIESSDQFFRRLKQILKTAGRVLQQEILISRIDCRLI